MGKRRHKDKRSVFLMGTSIKDRPEEVNERQTLGHWELDTVVFSRGEAKGCFATFIERKTILYTAIPMKDRTENSMQAAITQLNKTLPAGTFKTATCDRRKEFACASKTEQEPGIRVYFADAYCAWQRGSNENANGLLREFYPKETELGKVTQKELTEKLMLIDARPKKCLGWKSPIEAFLNKLAHLI